VVGEKSDVPYPELPHLIAGRITPNTKHQKLLKKTLTTAHGDAIDRAFPDLPQQLTIRPRSLLYLWNGG
jgi:hypothetical protein